MRIFNFQRHIEHALKNQNLLMLRSSAAILATAFILILASTDRSNATTYTFDTSADLTSNFDSDVLQGDTFTAWRAGYDATTSYEGSDGGFVWFNGYHDSNSIQFKSGPVTLNSFEISSQWYGGGRGVIDATNAGDDYRLILYDVSLNVLFDQTLFAAANGAWEAVLLNLSNVSIIQIAARSNDGTGTGGWWPSLDNIVVNESISAVPLPPSAILFGTALLGLAGLRRRKRKAA